MKIKKSLIVLLCVIMCVVLFACDGVYTPGNLPSGNPDGNNGGNDDGSYTPDDDTDEDVFTVQLINNKGEKLPANPEYAKINAIWTNVESSNGAYVTAAFDKTGKATVKGLDGDYTVTLSSLPDDYTYNPNIYIATSNNPHVEIVMYKLLNISDPKCTGSNWLSDVCELGDGIGAYRAVLTEENFESGIRFRFQPNYQGTYSVTSMIDTTVNKVNPYLDFHSGNAGGFINPTPRATQDGGGAENTYTKNFCYKISLDSRTVGAPYFFRIYATTLDKNVFPVTVDFILDRDGEVETVNKYQHTEVVAKHDFNAAAADAFAGTDGKTFKYYADYLDNNGVLDGQYVEYLESEGYYYITKTKVRNIATGNYDLKNLDTPIRLYASINRNEISDEGFTGGNVKLGWIEGKEADYGADSTVTDENEKNKTRYYDYGNFVTAYSSHAPNGYYPVTKELQIFIQRFSITQRYFNDGNGYAEGTYQSTESNQWLYACGFFQ